ncbi:unnamed protein product [Danaus chrysippus]|uniref:(African queen) hypothetical protein n=1 Tax=Danaus chrysippus TaxID=151541 RepID=A0A8J2QZW4_9NEOP|nr:unnamed protein product [Danaus chrysippus]
MFSFTAFLLSSVVLCTAQNNNRQQEFIQQGQENGKQFVSQDFAYIIAPLQFNSQGEDGAEASNLENQEKLVEAAQGQVREEQRPISEESQDAFYRKVQELIGSGQFVDSLREQKPREQQLPNLEQESQLQNQFEDAIPQNENIQGGKRFSEEFQKQWRRIVFNNEDYLKSLKAISSDSILDSVQLEGENESERKEEQQNVDVGSGIRYILRNHGVEGIEKQNVFGSEESNNQNRPLVFQQQRKRIEDNQALLKALSAVSEDQISNVAEPKPEEQEQENDEVRKIIEDILKKRDSVNKQNRSQSKQSNFGRFVFVKNNLNKVKAQKQSDAAKDQQRDIEVRKLIEDVLRKRENQNEQNDFKSVQSIPALSKQQLEQISNNNRIHLKALSTISEEQLLKELSAFEKRS